MLFVAMGRSLLIFSDVTFKMAARQPYWIFQFPDSLVWLLISSPNFSCEPYWFMDSNFSSALNIKSQLHWQITCVYGKKPIGFQQFHFQNGHLVAILDFSYLDYL